MILIYSNTSSLRLQYICKFIFKEQLGIAYSLTIDQNGFRHHEGPKINYSDLEFDGSVFNIQPHGLLFQTGIKDQEITCFEQNGRKGFFKTSSGSDCAFDIFAASFYLLSRYEEYVPHRKDIYNRYSHENSLAFREGFLQIPLVNNWLEDLSHALEIKFPNLVFQLPEFSYIPTYDIDIAWSYRHKGVLRNIGGFLKSPSMERFMVLTRLKKDPFNCYAFLDMVHEKYKLHPIYFFLVATSRSLYDKNISPYSNAMWQLMKQHAKKYSVGLHPSWRSNDELPVLLKEKKILETATNTEVKHSRQHYIKFTLPATFEKLIDAGIENEYSMGYGSINGFRASCASSFYWYNLQKESITSLRLHPFCYMDANSFYEQHLDAEQAFDEIMHYYDLCKKARGAFIPIFHNHFLGTDKQLAGWKDMYLRFISQAQQ